MADAEFKVDRQGIREIFKSDGMQAVLGEVADELSAKANSAASTDGLHTDHFERPPYRAHVDVLTNTTVGAVSTSGVVGRAEEYKHHTLESINH